jgi:hypothetical protein
MEKLQKCVNFILTVPVFFATSCRSWLDIVVFCLTVNLFVNVNVLLEINILCSLCCYFVLLLYLP